MTEDDVLELLGVLDELEVEWWLLGGWGVDALVGRQTRPHRDLDVAVPLVELPRIEARLPVFRRTNPEEYPGFALLEDTHGRRLDLLLLTGDRQQLAGGGDVEYPQEQTRAAGTIGGRQIRCASAALQRRERERPDATEQDRADLAALARRVGRVAGLWRYPVKSLSGESLTEATVESRGLAGDRLWAVRDPDGKLGSGKTTRRFRRMDGLLALAAAYDRDVPVVAFPDGRSLRGGDGAVHAALSEHVGRPVRLAREDAVSHFDEGPVHLVTTASLHELERLHGAPVDVRRLRPNMLLEVAGTGFVEDGWYGRRLRLGPDVTVEIRGPMPRCLMVDLPQVDVATDRRLLKTIVDSNETNLGIVADVVQGGRVRVGDVASWAEPA